MIGIFFAFILIFTSFLVKQTVKPEKVLANDPLLKPHVEQLKSRIKTDLKEFVPEEYVEKIFSSPELVYLPNIMIRRLSWQEAKLPYHQFLEEERIQRAYKFLQENLTLLDEIERVFEVDKETIVAIFLVETNLGQNTGKFPVFNVFFSLALSGDKDLLKNFVQDPTISLEDEKNLKIIERRSKWAYNELLYFIRICYENRWDPFSIKGSIFGAFGYPQFVPKSYFLYGYDWNKDGIVDLFDLEDALASIANYLKNEGYRKEKSLEERKKAIMKYNLSEPYANTVLAISEKLKELNNQKGDKESRLISTELQTFSNSKLINQDEPSKK